MSEEITSCNDCPGVDFCQAGFWEQCGSLKERIDENNRQEKPLQGSGESRIPLCTD